MLTLLKFQVSVVVISDIGLSTIRALPIRMLEIKTCCSFLVSQYNITEILSHISNDHNVFHPPFQMRVLKNDFARYNLDDDEADELDQEENGWKIVHTDVFRFPPYKSLLCSILGT